nr:2-oxo acid dehydrogenase subunit E2 [uncultured Lichenicoccus sp.]
MSDTDILLERETANDETALVVAIRVASGQAVEEGELLFDIENSKATQEVTAPAAGILSHALANGQTVHFGVPIARILTPSTASAPAASTPEPVTDQAPSPAPAIVAEAERPAASVTTVPVQPYTLDPRAPPAAPRFSLAAAVLVAEYGLSAEQFVKPFVTAADVRALVQPTKPAQAPEGARPPVAVPSAPRVSTPVASGAPVTPRKRVEIDVLGNGAANSMLSVLGIGLGDLAIEREQDDLLSGRITDLVIYEAARLMRKFPKLNAFYEDGNVTEHADVHAGLAFDGGGRLVVFGISNADRASLPELSASIADAAERYAANQLTATELSRSTFTITDLSADGLCFMLPLLPRGQSCIIGITHNTDIGYQLYAGFDHRVTEGREVASFLADLRDRLKSFAARDRPIAKGKAECAYCGRSALEAAGKYGGKGLMRTLDGSGHDVLCCGSCWNGW